MSCRTYDGHDNLLSLKNSAFMKDRGKIDNLFDHSQCEIIFNRLYFEIYLPRHSSSNKKLTR